VHVWKPKEEKASEEHRCMVRDNAEEAKWKGLDVNEHWQHFDISLHKWAFSVTCPTM